MSSRTLQTRYTTLEWSADGRFVTKRRPREPVGRARYRAERQVNELLRALPAPVRLPALAGVDRNGLALTFEAIDGEPLGPKYPFELSDHDIDGIVDLVRPVGAYSPRRRWFRRLRSVERLRQAEKYRLLTSDQRAGLESIARLEHVRRQFSHGDVTARNVMRDSSTGELVLIDWEWAGLYPPGYELAFLWFSLVDRPGGRDRVEQHVRVSEPAFLLSALLVQLWHLQWFVPADFRANHLATRDELLERLL